MDGFIIIIGLLVLFYNLFKIVFNTIRVIFFKKKVKKFLKIDLVAELIYFLGWIVLMRNLVVLLPNQIFHSIVYCVAMLVFLINQKNKKIVFNNSDRYNNCFNYFKYAKIIFSDSFCGNRVYFYNYTFKKK